MPDFDRSPEGLAFSPAVLAAQERLGGRDRYRDAEWPIDISRDLAQFIATQRSMFLATASAAGQPYVQHRGGPPGFLQVLDSRTLAMADLPGNQQYITLGNLSENDRVELFLIDYMHRKRVKIWGRGRMVEDDPALVERLLMPGNPPWTARALVITVEAWDVNCPQHIPQRFEAADVAAAIEERERKIAALEAELAALRGQG
ncbi:MAG: pyridoxamine 5'-phosphate oxidase family protein [Sphingomonadales bacterium]|nr:pyridoxamine 5'-phosphate oxidase family protein [Sphingomonadales bacterium]